jgi:hypothetical protein
MAEKNSILLAFPGQAGSSNGKRINISRIYDQEYNLKLEKMYNKVDFAKA